MQTKDKKFNNNWDIFHDDIDNSGNLLFIIPLKKKTRENFSRLHRMQ